MVRGLLALVLGVLAFAGSPGVKLQSSRMALNAPMELQGYPCAKGYAWFHPDGGLQGCTVSRETAFGEAVIPAGSFIALDSDGNPNYVNLARDTSIRGYQCRGGGWLGSGEGASTAFYPSGKLKQCWLAADQEVQGLPCMDAGGIFAAVFHNGGRSLDLNENGKLHSCTLSKDFGGFKHGARFVQAP